METFAKLISAVSSLAWPLMCVYLIYKFYEPISKLIQSAQGRSFTIKVAGQELTMDEASEQQRQIIGDLQNKISEIEKAMSGEVPLRTDAAKWVKERPGKRILWVDDRPKNNSYIAAFLEDHGAIVDLALTTSEGLHKFQHSKYDIVISDMGRPESERAGIDLVREIRATGSQVPFYIFCGGWAAQNLRTESLDAGATDITSSGTTLLSILPLSNGN